MKPLRTALFAPGGKERGVSAFVCLKPETTLVKEAGSVWSSTKESREGPPLETHPVPVIPIREQAQQIGIRFIAAHRKTVWRRLASYLSSR